MSRRESYSRTSRRSIITALARRARLFLLRDIGLQLKFQIRVTALAVICFSNFIQGPLIVCKFPVRWMDKLKFIDSEYSARNAAIAEKYTISTSKGSFAELIDKSVRS